MLQFVLIIHHVDNFQKWKEGFDKAASIRKKAGEQSFQVLVDRDDPNKVVHFSCWKSHDLAKQFFESDEVKEIRKNLGVDQPTFIYLNEIENGVL